MYVLSTSRYHTVNEYWDRIEKCLYLFIDAFLNWYFLKTVKSNLINNGLTKYNKLVRFNQYIVILSLLMDVMIIAAMSIPNSFVSVDVDFTYRNAADSLVFSYIQFHPLAYLVKLNIEMTMANLIKRIAISTSRRTGMASIAQEFRSSSNMSSSGQRTGQTGQQKSQRGSIHELATFVSYTTDSKANDRIVSFAPTGNQIKKTREIVVRNEPNPDYERRGSEIEITGGTANGKTSGVVVEERSLERRKSLESITEGNESLKSAELPKRGPEDSDDEAALVGQKTWWPRRKS
jgi:hypothetical protein